MRLHILGVPHTKTTDEFTTCAFTMKVRNLCKMMHARGHEVFHYGAEGSNPECTEHVSVVTAEEWDALYKHPGTGFYDLATDGKYAPFHAKWALSAKKAMLARMGPHEYGDIICLTWGGTQRAAADGVPQCHVESGIGYPHSWANYRVYESYAWMHMHLGRENIFGGGKWYWAVIPNAFDIGMFDYNPAPPESRGDELLYIGRLNNDKGVSIACDAAREAGLKLLLVGQGNPEPFLRGNPHVRYSPPVGVEGRRKLMAGARAVICPTVYIEPFCGVHVEAMLSGTPVITTDWGVFCVPVEETKILTKRGWLTKDEVQAGQDETLGYDVTTGENRWTRITAVNTFPAQQTEQYRNRNWTVRVTKNHRWVALQAKHVSYDQHTKTRTLASIGSLTSSEDRIRLSAEACGGDLETTDRQAAIIAWFLTDGGLEKYDNTAEKRYSGTFDVETDDLDTLGRARIFQSKPEGLAAIRELLKDVPHEESERPRVQTTHLPQHVFSIPVDIARKIIRAGDIKNRGLFGFILGLSRKAREAFLRACIEAEGWRAGGDSTIVLSQNEGPVLEAMRLCAYLCGHRPSLQKTDEKCKSLSLCNPLMAPSRLHHEPGRIEDVWCPTTELGSWTMMFGSDIMLTGNSETVLHGVTGYRCRTMEQFVWAAKNVHKLSPEACRTWAFSNFSLERVSLMYEEFFQQVLNLRHRHPNGGGFYVPDPGREQLDWLRRRLPDEASAERIDLTRKHVPTPDPGPETAEQEWDRAQKFERDWWGLNWAPHWDEELKKQLGYFRLMDMPADFDFGDKSILDVGCGPVSLLQRSKHGESRGVDPLAISKETAKRYDDAGVEFINIKAEDMPADRAFDEIWMYNCLQHTEDPHAIIRKIVSMGRAVRIFEWIDIKEKHEGHPQLLHEQMFLDHFGGPEYERLVWNVGSLRDFGGTATNRYIAIHAVRKTPLPIEAATGQAA